MKTITGLSCPILQALEIDLTKIWFLTGISKSKITLAATKGTPVDKLL